MLTLVVKDALEWERVNNVNLHNELEDANGAKGNRKWSASDIIPRRAGTAGTNFSIQVAMGLSGSSKKNNKYKAIQVS